MPTFAIASGSLGLRTGLIALLTLLMLWPLAQVRGLIEERQQLREQAYANIAESYGAEQTIGGAVLSVPIEQRTESVSISSAIPRVEWKTAAPRVFLADTLDVQADVQVTTRYKGIYRFPVYRTKLVLTGEFPVAGVLAALESGADVRAKPEQASLSLPLTGLRSLREVTRFDVGGMARRARRRRRRPAAALRVPLDVTALDRAGRLPFRIELTLDGSEALRFLPLGARTRVTLKSNWPHPSFDGAFLPLAPANPSANGFSAEWSVLELNRALPQTWRANEVDPDSLRAMAFGFRVLQPTDIYARSYRAVRYGVLFVAITFLCFFTWEALSRRARLHPMHYLLVGLALATFYLLLLALSEHLGFAVAYAAAAFALVALIGVYVSGASGSARGGLAIGAALAAAYAALYTILLSVDYALLLGALLVFAVLAVLMLATRRLDWAGLGATPPLEERQARSDLI
jgi:inner membrane protein